MEVYYEQAYGVWLDCIKRFWRLARSCGTILALEPFFIYYLIAKRITTSANYRILNVY